MPKRWVRERKRDPYYRKAKDESYRSRAAYKLFQAQEKYHFFSEGDVVVDLGAAPGGWLQAVKKIVGEKGFILGVDLKEIESLDANNVRTIVGDVSNSELVGRVKDLLPSKADIVISDVSPNLSGVWEVDHARQIDLAYKSLTLALAILKTDGKYFVKVFQGDMFMDFLGNVRRHFQRVKVVKPKASRSRSAEVYVLGIGLWRRD